MKELKQGVSKNLIFEEGQDFDKLSIQNLTFGHSTAI